MAYVSPARCSPTSRTITSITTARCRRMPKRRRRFSPCRDSRPRCSTSTTPSGASSRDAARGGRLVVVFGAGGDRDPAKRPVMGAVAERGADRVIITSDNPRSEDPLRIIEAIASGMRGTTPREPDRRRAIEIAVLDAAPEDVVLLAGKGHESYQEIAGERLAFSDQAVARA